MSVTKPLTYVHADARIVHAPKTCADCDQYGAALQELRLRWGINFTGQNDPQKLPCPSDWGKERAAFIALSKLQPNVDHKPYCKNCQYLRDAHDNGHCPHLQTTFEPLSLEEKHTLIRDATIRMAADVLGIRKR